MKRIEIVEHPILTDMVTRLRMKDTPYRDFRFLVSEVSSFVAHEITKTFKTELVEIDTPVAKTAQPMLVKKDVSIIPILRAGFGMVEGFNRLIPEAHISLMGIFRDPKTLEAVEYYQNIHENIADHRVIILDPMLATGVTIVHTLDLLAKKGCKNVDVAVILASPEGIHAIQEKHPKATIYTCAVDEKLNDHAYIIPGLGDAGDRIFGTGKED